LFSSDRKADASIVHAMGHGPRNANGKDAQHAPARVLFARLPLTAIMTFGVRIAAAAITYLVQILLSRSLGEHEYGVFALAWVWVMIGGYLACLGLAQATVRFLPQYRALGETGLERGFFRFAMQVPLLLSILLAAGVTAGLFAAESFGLMAETLHWPFIFGAACLPFFALQDMLESIGRANQWALAAFVPPYILRGLFMLAAAFGLMEAGWDGSAATAMFAALLGTIAASAIHFAAIVPRYLRQRPIGAPQSQSKAWLKAGFPLLLSDGALMLRQYVDVLLLGFLVPPAQLAIYFAASRIMALVGLIEYSVGAMTGPRFSVAAALDDRGRIRATLQQSVLMVFWPTWLAACGLIVLSPWLLGFFGEAFRAGAGLLPILAIGPIMRAAAGSSEEFLNMAGKSTVTLRAHLIALVGGILAIVMLVPILGLTGAAIASSLAATINGIALIMAAARETDSRFSLLKRPALTPDGPYESSP
jgi:O-antigen/teichoic acid export membrane protein